MFFSPHSLLVCALLLTTHQAQSQPMPLAKHVPAGFTILNKKTGDLNQDGIDDMIVVLENQQRLDTDVPRPLLILLGSGNRMYRLLARNDDVVLNKDEGGVFGDPFEGIAIRRGYFSIEHYGGSAWRWTRVITFRYVPAQKQFVLHRDAGVSYHTSDPEKTDNIVTNKAKYGKQLFTDYSNDF
jgi:hypothetical protein